MRYIACGSGEKRILREYIKDIRDRVKPEIELYWGGKSYNKNQVMYLCADISKLRRDTGFVPEVNFKEGIAKTIDWYKGRIIFEED